MGWLVCRACFIALPALLALSAGASAQAPDAPRPGADASRPAQSNEPALRPGKSPLFPPGAKSGVPCEFFGPCGKCDCPKEIELKSEKPKEK